MRAQQVQSFKRGQDPKRALGVGHFRSYKDAKKWALHELLKAGIEHDDIYTDDFESMVFIAASGGSIDVSFDLENQVWNVHGYDDLINLKPKDFHKIILHAIKVRNDWAPTTEDAIQTIDEEIGKLNYSLEQYNKQKAFLEKYKN